ncbi:PAS domain-containing sensor histidine kinase [Dictyobacter formicarum]|uniref:histidine kinase n=1 Tax=Dictyobacter formicarum TaxID=2778368 RepID=A0ABQ3V946_9CHLR|nr:PAS domain-containing protein [Dictyobacter formicarum]GHO82637.1 hypothetical protein KSZ_06430 [Dictyobacter formicarum]
MMLNGKQIRHLTLPLWKALIKHIAVQKRAEQQLKACEENFRVLAETVPHQVWTAQPDGSVTYSNQRWYDYTGASPEQALGEEWSQFLHPDDSQHVLMVWHHAVETGNPYEVEYRFREGQTGAYRWFLARGMPMRDDAGQIVKWFGTATNIDEQKRLEEDLRVLAETVPQLVWVKRPDGLYKYTNQRWRDYTGLMLEHMQNDPWPHLQFIHPDDRESNRAHWQHALDTGEMFEHKARLRNGQTGEYRWFLTRAMPVRDEAGQIVKWFGTNTDIEEQKQAEERIKISEENWRMLAETVPQLVWTTQPDGRVDYVNQRYCDYTQATLEHIRDDGWHQIVHPEDIERTLALRRQTLATGEPYEIEYRLKNRQTGEYHWFLTRGLPVRNEAGQIIKWFGTSTDIEDQKRAEQQLKESRENLRVLAETVPQLVWVKRPDGLYKYTNQRWRDYTGLTPQQIQSDRWAFIQFIHPDDQEGHRAHWQHALDTGEMFEHKARLRNGQTGEYRWFLVRAMPVRDEAGQIVKWFGTNTDIEDQVRIEEALRQSQERANALMNSNIIGITIIEGEQIVDANDTYLRMTGYTREDLRAGNMNWRHMTPSEYLDRTFEAHQELATQQSLTPYEKEYVCQDGSRLPALVGAVVLPHQPRQAIAFVLDNSARKELEQRKDTFLSMASHELRTPLTAVKMQTQLVRRRLVKQAHHEAATELSRVEEPIKQLERLIGELLDVSKMQAGRLEYVQGPVNLDVLLREIIDTLQPLHPGHTILLRDAVQISLMGDRDRLGQVFTNLLSNAIKYSPNAKTVEVDLDASPEAVAIRVRDHGLGIPREQRDKIFERFYRAAGPRQREIAGLGMGLYIVAEIVKHYGGTISVESEVGKGSTFTVTLPLTRNA